MDKNAQSILPRWFALAIYVAAALATVAALIVHLTDAWNWQVDTSAFALIGILLVIPAAERLHKFKVGKYFEAEFEERVKTELDHLGEWVAGLHAAASAPDELPGEATGRAEDVGGEVAARTIERIVWVDDQPANNRFEIAELRQRFQVETATSTSEALKKIRNPDATAVITDAVRVENGDTNLNAGVELLEALKEKCNSVPAYVYCGLETAESYAGPLEAAGARIVTSSFVELAHRVRVDAKMSFEAEVAAMLGAYGEVEMQSAGVDFVVERDGKRTGVEAKDYRRTPKREPVDAAIQRLSDAIGDEKIQEGWVVAPHDVFIDAQRNRAPEKVGLLSIDQLRSTLATPNKPADRAQGLVG